jgi:hypothetical protein
MLMWADANFIGIWIQPHILSLLGVVLWPCSSQLGIRFPVLIHESNFGYCLIQTGYVIMNYVPSQKMLA